MMLSLYGKLIGELKRNSKVEAIVDKEANPIQVVDVQLFPNRKIGLFGVCPGCVVVDNVVAESVGYRPIIVNGVLINITPKLG